MVPAPVLGGTGLAVGIVLLPRVLAGVAEVGAGLLGGRAPFLPAQTERVVPLLERRLEPGVMKGGLAGVQPGDERGVAGIVRRDERGFALVDRGRHAGAVEHRLAL